jgi:hypothetical protein
MTTIILKKTDDPKGKIWLFDFIDLTLHDFPTKKEENNAEKDFCNNKKYTKELDTYRVYGCGYFRIPDTQKRSSSCTCTPQRGHYCRNSTTYTYHHYAIPCFLQNRPAPTKASQVDV